MSVTAIHVKTYVNGGHVRTTLGTGRVALWVEADRGGFTDAGLRLPSTAGNCRGDRVKMSMVEKRRSTAVSENKPWSPNLGKSKDFTDHTNPALGDDPPLRMPLPNEDSAPLQGSKDLSDEDSLEDVIAESYEPEAETPTTVSTDRTKLPPEKFRP
jgi:hypothetical protein